MNANESPDMKISFIDNDKRGLLTSITFTGDIPTTPPPGPQPTATLQEWDAVGKVWVANAAGKDLVVPVQCQSASKPTLYVAVFPGLPSPINSGDYLLTFHDPVTKAIVGNPVPITPPVLNGSVPRYLLAVIQ